MTLVKQHPTSTMPTQPIPPEINDAIIEFVEAEDKETLRACTLVCRDWLPASRHRLFRHIEISKDVQYLCLVKHILQSETARQYLRSTVSFSLWEEIPMPDVGEPKNASVEKTGEDSAIEPVPASRMLLCDFAGHLPNLRALSIEFARWYLHLPLLREPLLLSTFPAIQTLHLGYCLFPNVAFLRRILASMAQLRCLELIFPSFAALAPATTSLYEPSIQSRRQLPELETLELLCDCEDSSLDPILAWLSASHTPDQSSIRQLIFQYPLKDAPIPTTLRPSHADLLQTLAPGLRRARLSPAGKLLVQV